MTNKKRILVADDDVSIVASLQFILEDEGFDVVCVTTPEAARAQVSESTFDCVLLDCLPDVGSTSA